MESFKRKPANKNSLSNRSLVHGIGISDAWYVITSKVNGKKVMCPVYQKWVSMINRCYDEKTHKNQPTYKGCTVCKEWLTFSNFATWCDKNYVEGYHLDKDIKIKGNKIYSPEACVFVPPCINALFTDRLRERGKCPIGVHVNKKDGKFISQISIDGRRSYLGLYSSESLAYQVYAKAKNAEIMRKCDQYPEFAEYLINHLLEE